VSEPHHKYDITGSIVLYNTNPAELEQAIRCFMDTPLRAKMVIVDNSPTQELSVLCRSLGTEYIHAGTNLGFGAAHNIAFNHTSTSKYHIVLNPDVALCGTVIQDLVAFLDLNESVGLVMPRVVYPDGSMQKLCKRLPTPFDILAKRLFPAFLKKICHKRLSAFELCDMDMTKVLSVPYLSGCFMLLRRNALQEVGFFDERFFMYFEDLDLTRRIHERYQTVYYPYATITHRHEKGSYKSAKLLYYGILSAILYFNKWGWVCDQQRDAVNSTIGPVDNLAGLPEKENL
jgi:GT2 family glycosyltransferase